MRPSRYKAAFGGRGSAKSHFFGTSAVVNAISKPGLRMVCLREVQKSLKESAKLLIEDKITAMNVGHEFRVLNDHIQTPHGGLIIFQGMQEHTADSIKSLEGFDVAWIEEAHTLSSRSWEILRPTIRKAGSEIWASWNPRAATDPVDTFFRGLNPPENAIVKRVNYLDNPFFPDELEAERRYDEANNRDRYGHIWLGEYEPQAIGAIWDRLTLHQNRLAEVPDDLARIVVAVDPAVSSEEWSDEHGIVVCARDEQQHGYVLDDVTTKGPPRKWADRAIAAYDRWDADCIVIEINQGGDMCKNTLLAARPGLPIREVRATRGKHVRAEPIAALYSFGRVHHVGTFPELEDQLCLITAGGYEGKGSPDRADALVWGLTELFPAMIRQSRDPVHVESIGAGGWMG